MLKIKDSVDLKELKKFNFKLDSDEWYVNGSSFIVYIKPVSRKISIKTRDAALCENIDIVYDLIQANLVEKVEEKQ